MAKSQKTAKNTGRKKQEHAATNARRARIWKQWVRGRSETELAEAEGVAISTICRDLQARHEQIREAEAASIAKGIAERDRAVSVYRDAITEAWTEWERSKGDKKRSRQKAKQGGEGTGGGTSTEAEETTEGRLGDPQYINAIVRAQARIDDLHGLVVSKHEHSGPKGAAIPLAVDVVALLHEPDYLEYLRQRACAEDSDAGDVRPGGK